MTTGDCVIILAIATGIILFILGVLFIIGRSSENSIIIAFSIIGVPITTIIAFTIAFLIAPSLKDIEKTIEIGKPIICNGKIIKKASISYNTVTDLETFEKYSVLDCDIPCENNKSPEKIILRGK